MSDPFIFERYGSKVYYLVNWGTESRAEAFVRSVSVKKAEPG